MQYRARQLLRILLALVIVIAGTPVHGQMPVAGDSDVPDHMALKQHGDETEFRCPSHAVDDSADLAFEPECDPPECCGDDCRMQCAPCAGMMLVLPLDAAPCMSAPASFTLVALGRLHVSAELASLLRPPQD